MVRRTPAAIDVRRDGGAPYELQGLFDVADDLYREATPGVTVPVKVHPSKPKRVAKAAAVV